MCIVFWKAILAHVCTIFVLSLEGSATSVQLASKEHSSALAERLMLLYIDVQIYDLYNT